MLPSSPKHDGEPRADHDIVENANLDQVESHVGHVKHMNAAADEATELEHTLPILEVCRIWWKAIICAVLFTMCIVMDGYDGSLITNLYGMPAFAKKYGYPLNDGSGDYNIPAGWQTAMALCSPIGRIIGGALQGQLSESLGRKKTLMLCLTLVTGFIFITFFAESRGMLLAGLMLCGVVWGIIASLGPTYASEITPVRLRGILTAYINLCWSMGGLIGTGILAGMQKHQTQWGYRIPFALQWMWPVIIMSYLFFLPESPYWLIRKGRTEDARRSLQKLIAKPEKVNVDQMLALIQRTNEREQMQRKSSQASYLECFRGLNLRRTEISAMSWSCQALSGLSIGTYGVIFFKSAGLGTQQAYNLNVGMQAVGFCGTIASFFLINRFGRRTLFFRGLCVLTTLMLTIGFLGLGPKTNPFIYAEASLLIVWFCVYYLTIGPVAYVIFSETSATYLRSHTVAISLMSYSTLLIAYHNATPQLFNPTSANLGAKTAIIYGGISLIACTWCYFRLPECKDRTFEEIDILFERKVPAREFKGYVIND